ncbi:MULTISPECIES: RICIN domain-containing protein [unclassified Anabaena]|uniref:RICIN domain-containing protein n=1 Tax=unclassified Anabaena TaxID=2619674 RepID=UPI0006AC798D|nr:MULTISPECIES: RICIN domain-containing protein [unclassified Anabaena]ALB42413.1 hypothetical protein AA650_19850 [Anabaena sp. WA102]OBQ23252.1 MAG: hypothetical protein AN486_00160 [Anabaena sp. AL93]
MNHLLKVATGALFIAGISLGNANLAQGAVTIERIKNNDGSGYALNLYNLNSRVNLYDLKNPDSLEKWDFDVLGSGDRQTGFATAEVRIKSNYNSNYCMTASSANNNASIYVRPCGQAANQNFIKEDIYNGSFTDVRFRLKGTNSCINAPNVNLWNGGYVFMYACNATLTGDPEQTFRIRSR